MYSGSASRYSWGLHPRAVLPSSDQKQKGRVVVHLGERRFFVSVFSFLLMKWAGFSCVILICQKNVWGFARIFSSTRYSLYSSTWTAVSISFACNVGLGGSAFLWKTETTIPVGNFSFCFSPIHMNTGAAKPSSGVVLSLRPRRIYLKRDRPAPAGVSAGEGHVAVQPRHTSDSFRWANQAINIIKASR